MRRSLPCRDPIFHVHALVCLAVAALAPIGCGEPVEPGAVAQDASRSVDDAGTTWDAGVVADASAVSDATVVADVSAIADASVVADASAVADAATPDTTSADSPLVMACGTTGLPSLTDLSPEELSADLQAKDFLLINVASATGGQIPQTDSYVPYDDTAALVAFIGPDLDTEVVLYCNSGGRSRVAGNSLVALGYCQVSHLAGGKNAWVAAGYELE